MSEAPRTYVVDTHPLIWHLEGSGRLGPTAREVLRDPESRVIVPTLVLVELAFVRERGRTTVTLDGALAHVEAAPNCALCVLDDLVIGHLPMSLNIHDAIIVGTALMLRDVLEESVALITKDEEIVRSGLVEVVW